MPLADASVDIVTSIFLFHELPPDVRRQVTAEIARVLKPGGLFVFLDSLQMGDKPGWDGLLEAFPHRFHEPYFRRYAVDDLEGMFSAAGLAPELDVDAVPCETDGAAEAVNGHPGRLSPGSNHPLSPEQAERWIPGDKRRDDITARSGRRLRAGAPRWWRSWRRSP